MAASRRNLDVLWVHNDSGDSARVFAISTKGQLLGICNIAGATARDWEDIAVGPGPDPNVPYLYLGDIGDNNARRASVRIYRTPEPAADANQPFDSMRIGPADVLELTYPDGPRDAETLMVDPIAGDIYIISKRELLSRVYRARWPQQGSAKAQLQAVTVLPWGFAVAGDISPKGHEVVVRGLYNASLWIRPKGQPLWHAFADKPIDLPLAPEPQGESICFDRLGVGYFTISEMANPPLYYFARGRPADADPLSDAPASTRTAPQ